MRDTKSVNIWAFSAQYPLATVAQAVAAFDDWRDFWLWSDVVSGRHRERIMRGVRK